MPRDDDAHVIAVTGANGFVGGAVSRALSGSGFRVRRLTRVAGPGLTGVGEIGPETAWTAALAGCRTVVHLAAHVHRMGAAAHDGDASFRRVNVEGTVSLARQAAEGGVRRLVFMSSIKVNGEATQPGQPFRASDPPMPLDAYGRSKLEAEETLRDLAKRTGLEVVVIRAPLVYGAGVRANFRAMIRAVASGVPLPLGAVRNRRSLIGVENLADLVRVCVAHPDAPGGTLLASDGEDLSTPELLRALARSLGVRARLVPVPVALLRGAASLAGRRAAVDRLTQSLQVDASATRQRLGWMPPLTVAGGFRRASQEGWLKPAVRPRA